LRWHRLRTAPLGIGLTGFSHGARDAYGQHQIVHHMRYDNTASGDAATRAEAFLSRWPRN
jgi:hypothetical protein